MRFTNQFGQVIMVVKNPKSWTYSYSVRAKVERGVRPYIVSQHRTKRAAASAAGRLKNRDVRKVLGWS